MASTNKTPNYNLSQFIATDKPAWLTDVNGDMSKIDTAIKSVSDRVGVNETAITEAEANIEDNASNITTLQATTGQHGTDITDLKAQDIIIKNDVTNLTGRVATLESKNVYDELWTNPNPTTNMSSNSISFDYSNYSYLLIIYKAVADSIIYNSAIIPSVSGNIAMMSDITSNLFIYRALTLTPTGANIGAGNVCNSYGTNSADARMCVPYKILGIK